jgi:hypothetical protein
MKVKELIDKLNAIYAKQQNIEVKVIDSDGYYNEIDYIMDDGYDEKTGEAIAFIVLPEASVL